MKEKYTLLLTALGLQSNQKLECGIDIMLKIMIGLVATKIVESLVIRYLPLVHPQQETMIILQEKWKVYGIMDIWLLHMASKALL